MDQEFRARVTRCRFTIITPVSLWEGNFRLIWTADTIFPYCESPTKAKFWRL